MLSGPGSKSEKFSEIRQKFNTGEAFSSTKSGAKASEIEDAGLVTNQARRFLLDVTGEEATIEDAFSAQAAILSQYESSYKDRMFALALSTALDAGLTEEEAFEQAEASVKSMGFNSI